MNKNIVIVGGGVSGLVCCCILVKNNIKVDLYDSMDKPGRKLLLAGMSGLNITKNEEVGLFSARYGKDKEYFKTLLSQFSPEDLILWFKSFGIETFTGTSGKVFPVSMNADEILEKILSFLESSPNFTFFPGHTLFEICDNNSLRFKTAEGLITVNPDTAVFALGGGSWPKTGSDGKWVSVFRNKDISVNPLKPANCGFETDWSDEFLKNDFPVPVKNICLSCGAEFSRGEILLTEYGLEGGGVYDLSREIREIIEEKESAVIKIDLLPDLSENEIVKRLSRVRGKNSLSNYLRKSLSINSIKFRLIKELLTIEEFKNIQNSSWYLKNLELKLLKPRSIEEAVSSAGGVDMDVLDDNMMIRNIPGYYVIGEMADWEAPTGGYLIQGCFSTAFAAAENIVRNYLL